MVTQQQLLEAIDSAIAPYVRTIYTGKTIGGAAGAETTVTLNVPLPNTNWVTAECWGDLAPGETVAVMEAEIPGQGTKRFAVGTVVAGVSAESRSRSFQRWPTERRAACNTKVLFNGYDPPPRVAVGVNSSTSNTHEFLSFNSAANDLCNELFFTYGRVLCTLVFFPDQVQWVQWMENAYQGNRDKLTVFIFLSSNTFIFDDGISVFAYLESSNYAFNISHPGYVSFEAVVYMTQSVHEWGEPNVEVIRQAVSRLRGQGLNISLVVFQEFVSSVSIGAIRTEFFDYRGSDR